MTPAAARPAPEQLLFLPGASGNTEFWKPVAARLERADRQMHHIGWPGFGPTPPDPAVKSLQDLARLVSTRIDRPTALVAQSMGGPVALLAAMEKPQLVTHLVLAALSGGVDVTRHGGRQWRPPREEIDRSDPSHLFAAHDEDLSALLPSLRVPVLLLWGERDPISPVGVGRWLSQVLPYARLHVVRDGDHSFCNAHASEVVPLIERHLLRVVHAKQANPRTR